jgi:glycerophosphoryl diester phosphodiesterase
MAVEGSGALVIAHRGASGYLPEHTLESAAYAHALGADFIEQDVVLSRDGELVVLHDIHLETTTDVAARFPGRARADSRYYAIDFSWPELRSLAVRERFDPVTGKAVFPGRFPDNGGPFRLCTLEEQLRLIEARRLMQSQGTSASIAAYAVGYESVPQFTREYGRMFGRPPVADARVSRERVRDSG